MSFVTAWMDLEGIMLSEIRQLEKDKYNMIPLLMWNIKIKINGQNRNRLIDTENKLMVARWNVIRGTQCTSYKLAAIK